MTLQATFSRSAAAGAFVPKKVLDSASALQLLFLGSSAEWFLAIVLHMLLNHSAAAGAIYQTACRATCALLPLPTLKTCLDPETVAAKMAASIAEHVPAALGSKTQLTEDDWRQFTHYVSLQSTAAAYIRHIP